MSNNTRRCNIINFQKEQEKIKNENNKYFLIDDSPFDIKDLSLKIFLPHKNESIPKLPNSID